MYILYNTRGCHLCEQALAVMENAGVAHEQLEVIDIAADRELVQNYGIRIPVVKDKASGAEIGWPFSAQDFIRWKDAL